jgi:hypothetical protein
MSMLTFYINRAGKNLGKALFSIDPPISSIELVVAGVHFVSFSDDGHCKGHWN